MKRHLHILYIFFVVGTMSSQEKQMKLSMNEAIDYALKNSYENRVAVKDIDAAKQKKWETTTIGLPQIEAKVDYQNWLKQQVSLLPAKLFDPTAAADALAPITFGTKQNLNATVTLTQLLFDGSYLVGLQAAKTYLQISKQAKEKTELGTREAVINAYGNVLVTEKSIEILFRNKKVNDRLLKGAKLGFENGLAEEEQVEQFEITKGNIDNNIRSAKRLKTIAYKMLNITLGNDIDVKLTLTDDLDSLVLSNTDLSLVSQGFDLDSHIDFKIAQNDRESKRLLMRLEQSKALPSLSAFINYGQAANSDTFSFLKSEQQWFDSSLLGVSLNIPIFSSFKRRSKTKQARIALETADIRLEEIKLKLKLQAENAKSDYQLSIDTYETAKKNLNLSERIEKKQQIKFNEGITTSFDLLQAQNQLYTQQNSYIQSMLNIIASKATLENALNIPIK